MQKKEGRGSVFAGANTFYFSEFPDNSGYREMWDVFQRFGKVVEVVIPNKKNRRGKRFGFVRFLGVKEPKQFAARLDKIFIGNQKMFVNIPRYQKDVWSGAGSGVTGAPSTRQHKQNYKDGLRKKDKTYAQVVGNSGEKGNNGGQAVRKGTNPGQFEFAHLKFNVDDKVVEQLNKAFVGVVSKSGTTYGTQDEFTRRGILEVKVTPMGANLVLLEEMEEGALSKLLSEIWISEWFGEIRSWCSGEIDNERIVWIRCFGVPAHAWSNEFFSFLVAGIGEFICVDDSTLKKKTMDVARILYKTKVHDLVSRLVKVNIGGDVFSIKMVEEWYGPLQWCMPKRHEDEKSFGSSSDDEEEEFQDPCDDGTGTFSDEGFFSDQSNDEQSFNPSCPEESIVGGVNNTLEGEMIKDIMERSEGYFNNEVEFSNGSNGWVADTFSMEGRINNFGGEAGCQNRGSGPHTMDDVNGINKDYSGLDGVSLNTAHIEHYLVRDNVAGSDVFLGLIIEQSGQITEQYWKGLIIQ